MKHFDVQMIDNENEIKHFINGTKLVEKHNIDSEAFYKSWRCI